MVWYVRRNSGIKFCRWETFALFNFTELVPLPYEIGGGGGGGVKY